LRIAQRIPHLRKKEASLKAELQTLKPSRESRKIRELQENSGGIPQPASTSAMSLNVLDRQRILRLVARNSCRSDTLTIKHSIPVSGSMEAGNLPGYLLCGRSVIAVMANVSFWMKLTKSWRSRGHAFVRYADDGMFMFGRSGAAQDVMAMLKGL